MLLGPANSIHLQRWANGLAADGWAVVCVSAHDFLTSGWRDDVRQVRLPTRAPWGYLLNARAVASVFKQVDGSLMNAHYATGYGLLATLSGVQPRVLSVWGMDVYDFPTKSPLHRFMVRQVLARARAVASTSLVMAQRVRDLMGPGWQETVAITPFGVDTDVFRPQGPSSRPTRAVNDQVVIGTVKSLAPKYGIDTLIRSFALLMKDRVGCHVAPLRLRLVGDGPQRADLQRLAESLGVGEQVEFVGAVPHADVPAWLRSLDIYVAASRDDSESFGVAAVEAGACALPVVVSDAGGLPEVVIHGQTGLVVPRDSPAELAGAIRHFVDDVDARVAFGTRGREHVSQQYEWRACVRGMGELYERVLRAARP